MSNSSESALNPSVTSCVLGLSIALVTLPGWLANLLLLVVLIYGGLVKTGKTIYSLMASLAVGDFITLSVMLFYLAPSSMAQHWLLPMDWISIPADFFLITWHHAWFMLSAISINRYVAVCHTSKYQAIFTHRFTNIIVLVSWILAGVIWTNVFWMPCCRILIGHITYSFMHEPAAATQPNIADVFVEMPGNAGTSLIMAVCYGKVMREIYNNSNMIQDTWAANREAQSSSMSQEKRLALQFLCISTVYTGLWVTFRVCPMIFGNEMLELYIIVTFLAIINSSINPFLYFRYTTEIKEKLAELRGVQDQGAAARNVATTAKTDRVEKTDKKDQQMELRDIEEG